MSAFSFSYAQMQRLCSELEQHVKGWTVVNCLPNDPRRFFITFQYHTKQELLFFCFSPPLIRFHLVEHATLPKQSAPHPLLHFLKGAVLIKADVLQNDRILQLTFETEYGKRLMIGEFFSKHPNYYLVESDNKILWALHSLNRTHYQPPPQPLHPSQRSPQWSTHREIEKAYAVLEKEREFHSEKQAREKQLMKEIKKLERKENDFIRSLKACADWEKVQHEGELIKFNFGLIKKGTTLLVVDDWLTNQPYELKFDSKKTIQDEMKERFKRAKKLKMGISPLTQQLEKIQKELAQIQHLLEQFRLIQTLGELVSFKKEHQLAVPESKQRLSAESKGMPKAIYKEFISKSGMKIWVGKNAKVNEQLTFRLANGRDWWLHVSGCPGSHVIIRLGNEEQPDEETLQDAMQLALYYSKARDNGEGEVCYTQRKYVARLGKGKTGQVQISKHRTAWIRFDPVRYNSLKER